MASGCLIGGLLIGPSVWFASVGTRHRAPTYVVFLIMVCVSLYGIITLCHTVVGARRAVPVGMTCVFPQYFYIHT